MKLKKSYILTVIIVILLSLSYFSYSVINFYFQILVEMFIVGIAITKRVLEKNYKIEKKWIYYTIMVIIPNVINFLYSVVIFIVENQDLSYVMNAFSTTLYRIIFILAALSLVYLYNENSIKIVTAGALLNYSLVLISFIMNYGIGQLIPSIYESIFDVQAKNYGLEAHEVTFVFGLLFVFYFLNGARKHKLLLLVLLFFMMAGYKRIQSASIIITIVVYFILKNVKKKKVFIKIITIILLFISLLWVFLIKSNMLKELGEKYNINFMSRLTFYEAIGSEYDFDLTFLGRGIGYTTEWMSENIFGTGLHSDILRMYIEEGMYIYIYIFVYYIYFNSIRIYKNNNKKNAIIFFSIMILTYITWFTDNVEVYQNYNLILHTIYFYSFLDNKRETVSGEC